MRISSQIAKLEKHLPPKEAHVVIVFISRPEDEAFASQQIEAARIEATRMCKELDVIRVGFVAPDQNLM